MMVLYGGGGGSRGVLMEGVTVQHSFNWNGDCGWDGIGEWGIERH